MEALVDTSFPSIKTFVVTALDAAGNASSRTVTYAVGSTLSALSPAALWIGLKNSDAVGLRLDIRTEVLLDGVVIGMGEVSNVTSGSSGFNNAILRTIPLALSAQSRLSPTSSTPEREQGFGVRDKVKQLHNVRPLS